jgi:integrase/recombinase XerD
MLTVKRVGRTLRPVRRRRVSTERMMAAWLENLTSPRTREAYGRDVSAFGAWCTANGHDLLQVGTTEVSSYRDDCRVEGVQPSTIARRLSALASFYDHALRARAVAANPVAEVARPLRRRDALSGETPDVGLMKREVAALFAAAARLGPKVVVLVGLLVLDGLKLAEVLALDIQHLRRAGRTMQATVTRRGVPQAIELDERTAHAIATYVHARTAGPLLVGDSPTQDGTSRLTRFGADFLLKRAAAGAGLERLSANTLRRTHIAMSHHDGATVEAIADRVGHANPRDTRRYLG